MKMEIDSGEIKETSFDKPRMPYFYRNVSGRDYLIPFILIKNFDVWSEEYCCQMDFEDEFDFTFFDKYIIDDIESIKLYKES